MDTPLHDYTRYGDYDGVEKALRDGHDPNTIGLYSWSPVHEAAHNGEKEILSLLLNHKGDPNLKDSLESNTAMHYAARNGHSDCLLLLLARGGNPDVRNSQGKTAVELATPECRALLEEAAMSAGEGEGGKTGSKDDPNNNKDNNGNNHGSNGSNGSNGGVESQDRKWNEIPLPDQPAMGFLHLSFEYHAHKNTVKVRVWQVSDLLLPPPQVSMINSIFIRGYFIPDPPRKTLRRTEEVRVWEPEVRVKDPLATATGRSFQHIFTPSSFKFSSPLIYTGVTPAIIQERSVQIEVMMTQRGSKRHFLIGMVHMPLRYAVKKLIREEFPLIPCMNHTIPSTMRVYSAHDLQLESSLTGLRPARSFRHSRSSSCSSEHSQDAVCNGVEDTEVGEPQNGHSWSPGCSSVGELEEVVAGNDRCRDFVSVSLGGSPCGRDEEGNLTEVTVSSNSLASDSSCVTINSGDDLDPPRDQDLKEVRVVSDSPSHHVVEIREPQPNLDQLSPSSPRKSAFRPTKEPKSPQQLRSRMSSDEEARLEKPVPKHLSITRLSVGSDGSSERDICDAKGRYATPDSPASSRPDTPCWDYYDLEEEGEGSVDEDDAPHALVLDPSLSLDAVRAMTSENIPSYLHPSVVLEDDPKV